MTGQALEVREQQIARLDPDQLKYIASTEFVPKSYRGNLPAIMACVATGRELGIGDLEALRSIYVVDGKPTLSAELMVRLVRRRGHSIRGEFNPESVTATGRRGDNGDEMTVTWTMEMAKRAGLSGKDNWKRYPEALLWARAASQLCRMLFPDVVAGVHYTDDEAELLPEDRAVEAVGELKVPDEGAPVDLGPEDPPSLASGPENPEPADEGQTAFPIPEKARRKEPHE